MSDQQLPSLTEHREIRIFISATFRDMVKERDALMSHTWPTLRRFCRERQVELVEVDLRWGIAEAQSTRRPYFIGLSSELYGWTPGSEAFTADLL